MRTEALQLLAHGGGGGEDLVVGGGGGREEGVVEALGALHQLRQLLLGSLVVRVARHPRRHLWMIGGGGELGKYRSSIVRTKNRPRAPLVGWCRGGGVGGGGAWEAGGGAHGEEFGDEALEGGALLLDEGLLVGVVALRLHELLQQVHLPRD